MQCKEAYESEYTMLARQFAEMQAEMQRMQNEKGDMRAYIVDLEIIIAQQRNFVAMEETMEAELADGEAPPEDES